MLEVEQKAIAAALSGQFRQEVIHGDCYQVMQYLPSRCVDSVVTDCPCGAKFMGHKWDTPGGLPSPLPGGNGFAQKASKKSTRAEKRAKFLAQMTPILAEALRVTRRGGLGLFWCLPRTSHWTATALEDAGWKIEDKIIHLFGSGRPSHKSRLKTGHEEWILCRKKGKPWLNIADCRVGVEKLKEQGILQGRWAANVILDESVASELDQRTGILKSGKASKNGHWRNTDKHKNTYMPFSGKRLENVTLYGDKGGPSKFFYCHRASKDDRGEGNDHCAVKPNELMKYLVRLVTRPGGIVLDPFCGSGSTGKACVTEGLAFLGIEVEQRYVDIAKRRIREANGITSGATESAVIAAEVEKSIVTSAVKYVQGLIPGMFDECG